MNEKRKIIARKLWIKTFEELGSVSKAARRCGIPRSTLYRWIHRYKNRDENCLKDKSKKPIKLAKQKVTPEIVNMVLNLRNKNDFGPQRISTALLREHQIQLSPPTIWRVLKNLNAKPLKRYRGKKNIIRYSRPIPGDRVQIDVTKICSKCYQFTAVDDCTRLRVLRIYSSKHATNTVLFLGEILDHFPFPIQRIQTDWGTEFFNDLFQEELNIHAIKFRPIKPRSPHLNGKVERSQKTDKAEFYSQIDFKNISLELQKLLSEWEYFYNYKRPHSSLNGKTPYEKYISIKNTIPLQAEISLEYMKKNEIIKPRNSKYLSWVEQK